MYCLSKAITADPQDLSLKFDRASLYVELGDYQKAAESYEQISRFPPELVEPELRPELVEALKKATKVNLVSFLLIVIKHYQFVFTLVFCYGSNLKGV